MSENMNVNIRETTNLDRETVINNKLVKTANRSKPFSFHNRNREHTGRASESSHF